VFVGGLPRSATEATLREVRFVDSCCSSPLGINDLLFLNYFRHWLLIYARPFILLKNQFYHIFCYDLFYHKKFKHNL
jgi:hypothetical protein